MRFLAALGMTSGKDNKEQRCVTLTQPTGGIPQGRPVFFSWMLTQPFRFFYFYFILGYGHLYWHAVSVHFSCYLTNSDSPYLSLLDC